MLRKTPGLGVLVIPADTESVAVGRLGAQLECRLWSISECAGEYSASFSKTGEPVYASQRHMTHSLRWWAGALSSQTPRRAALAPHTRFLPEPG